MKRFIKWRVVIILVVIIEFLSYQPVVSYYLSVPQDRYYYGAVSYPLDFLGILTIVRQGYYGKWQNYLSLWSVFPGRNDLSKGVEIMKIEYIFLGQFARLIGIDPLIMLYLVRFVSSVGLLIVIYWFLENLIQDKLYRIIAYLIILFSSGITLPSQSFSDSIITRIGDSLHPFQRFSMVSVHYLIGMMTVLIMFVFLAKAFKGQAFLKYFGLCIFMMFVSSLVFAPGAVFFLSSLAMYILLSVIGFFRKSVSKIDLIRSITAGLVLTIAAAIPAVLVRQNTINSLETEALTFMALSIKDYILAVGIVWIVSLITLPYLIRNKKILIQLVWPWVIIHPISIFFVEKVSLFGTKRIFQTPYLIIFTALAVIGIQSFISQKKASFSSPLKNIVLFGFFCLVIVSGLFSYRYFFLGDCFCEKPPFDYGYPKKDMMAAIFWLKNNTNPDDIVFSGVHAGTLIPAFSGNRVYNSWWVRLGMPMHYIHDRIQIFYQGQADIYQAAKILRDSQASYVFWSEEEQKYYKSDQPLPYKFLQRVFVSGKTAVYKVIHTTYF